MTVMGTKRRSKGWLLAERLGLVEEDAPERPSVAHTQEHSRTWLFAEKLGLVAEDPVAAGRAVSHFWVGMLTGMLFVFLLTRTVLNL